MEEKILVNENEIIINKKERERDREIERKTRYYTLPISDLVRESE